MTSDLERNKANVRGFYDLSFNQRQPEEATRRYIGAMYRQHNPMAADGPEAFIQFVRWFTGENPQLRVDFKRFIAEDDLVVVHCHIVARPGHRGTAAMDMFRLDPDGKIIEHWDVLQDVPEKSANANTMF